METIGERIKFVRKSNNRTQVQFARELGISQTHISKIEKGVEHPSEMLLLFICSMYGCSIEWLKSGIGESRKEPEDLEDALLACLLYTSPSPRDRQKSRMPSSA